MNSAAVVESLAHGGIHENESQLLAGDEVEAILAIQHLRQLVLLDELLDLDRLGFCFNGLLALLVEGSVARGLRGPLLLGGDLLLGRWRGGLCLRRRTRLGFLLAGLDLFFGDQPGLQ